MRLAALASNSLEQSLALRQPRQPGGSTRPWPYMLRPARAAWMSWPCSAYHMRSPFTFPHIRRSCFGWVARRPPMETTPARFRRSSILRPMPGTSDIGRSSRGKRCLYPTFLTTMCRHWILFILRGGSMQDVERGEQSLLANQGCGRRWFGSAMSPAAYVAPRACRWLWFPRKET